MNLMTRFLSVTGSCDSSRSTSFPSFVDTVPVKSLKIGHFVEQLCHKVGRSKDDKAALVVLHFLPPIPQCTTVYSIS